MGGEFGLIDQFFGVRSGQAVSSHVPVGIGDDCAVLRPSPGHLLLTSVDTFTEGVHFFSGTDPVAIGHKALAVNLSDLAACGAKPLGCLMALSLPRVDNAWLDAFSRGFLALAQQSECPLIGGDTTRSGSGGGISITVTVLGESPSERAILRRQGACAGDDVWISGELGAAALEVAARQSVQKWMRLSPQVRLMGAQRLDWPQPRLALGLALRGIASSAIDLSDGLSADLGHILKASGGLGAVLDEASLPLSPALDELPVTDCRRLALSGGDDYELCFTADTGLRDIVQLTANGLGLRVTRVGSIQSQPGLWLNVDGQGTYLPLETQAYEHFE